MGTPLDRPKKGTVVSNLILEREGGTWEFTRLTDRGMAVVKRKEDGSEKELALVALSYEGQPEPRLVDCTDAGNALRLVQRHGEDIHWVVEWRQWIVWDGSRWRPDTLGKVTELAKDTARSIYTEAAKAADRDDKSADDLAKWAKASLSERHLQAMVKLARTEPNVPIEAAQLDQDPWLLNCANGTLDLRTGKLQDADRRDLITKTTGVVFDAEAKCPEWEKFVKWAMDGRDDLVDFLWRALGYSLTGDVSERLIFFLHGHGRNGKSTMLEVLAHVLGDYAIQTAATTFEKPRSGSGASARPEIVQLKGARFVTSSELEDGTKLATALVKQLTGNETLSARPLYKDPIQFKPQFKAWIAANHKPTVPADDQAIWDRLRLVPFDARVPDGEVDRDKTTQLMSEAPGILAWMVRGCLEWREKGIGLPFEVAKATSDYRDEMDTFVDFLDWMDFTAEGFIGRAVDMRPAPLRELYNDWARAEGLPPMNQREFKKKMEAHGFTQAKSGNRSWKPPERPHIALDFAAMLRSLGTTTQQDVVQGGASLVRDENAQ